MWGLLWQEPCIKSLSTWPLLSTWPVDMLPSFRVWARPSSLNLHIVPAPYTHIFFGTGPLLYHIHSIPSTTWLYSTSPLHQEGSHFHGSQYFTSPMRFPGPHQSNTTLLDAYDLYTSSRAINTSGNTLHSSHSGISSQFHLDSPWSLHQENLAYLHRSWKSCLDLWAIRLWRFLISSG
jgi:hypothetical protein